MMALAMALAAIYFEELFGVMITFVVASWLPVRVRVPPIYFSLLRCIAVIAIVGFVIVIFVIVVVVIVVVVIIVVFVAGRRC